MFRRRFPRSIPQGLKPTIDLIGFVPGMNPRPTARTSFSAACKARADFGALEARLKSCPDTSCLSPRVFPQPIFPCRGTGLADARNRENGREKGKMGVRV